MADKPMTAARLVEIEAKHGDRITDVCGTRWPCDALLAAREIHRLRAENRLLQLSRERAPGQD